MSWNPGSIRERHVSAPRFRDSCTQTDVHSSRGKLLGCVRLRHRRKRAQDSVARIDEENLGPLERKVFVRLGTALFVFPTLHHVGEGAGHLRSRRACSNNNEVQRSLFDQRLVPVGPIRPWPALASAAARHHEGSRADSCSLPLPAYRRSLPVNRPPTPNNRPGNLARLLFAPYAT